MTTENISDDQELFLKVLENLKKAVTKPDSHVALPKKPVTHEQDTHAHSATLSSNAEISENESQIFLARSDTGEPGTTTVTVSNKTKSLILQKLACEKPYATENITTNEHSTSPPVITQTKTLVVNKGLDSLKGENDNGTQKTLYTARPLSYVKTNVNKTSEKSERVNQKQTSPSVQLYPCSFCDYYSDNKNYLKQHIDFVHISDRPFKCPYCEYAGKRSHALREHLIVHTDERPFQCTVCKATFRKKGHLTNHVKLHNSKRLVKCPLCKALVYDTGENGLDAHLKNDHDTERLYGCDLCDHIAANEPDIIKHLRQTHKTQIVSYKCEKCPYETANSVDFNAHVNAHKMADANVHIGENSPTKVLGVATFPSGTEQLGTANTSVKVSSVEPNTASKQPAVIKPVWIKCSECGFTGQDSEVIRNHMLDHLGLEIYSEKNAPAKGSMNLQTAYTEPKQTVCQKPSASDNAANPQTPILVPVTNIEFLPKQTGKIDMNSPILVPVTDAEMLKRLQQSAVSSQAQPPIRPSTQLPPQRQKPAATATTASDILKQTNRLTVPEDLKVLTGVEPTTTAQPLILVPNISSVPVQTVVTLSSDKIEQIVQNPNLRVIPLSSMSSNHMASKAFDSSTSLSSSTKLSEGIVTHSVMSSIVSSTQHPRQDIQQPTSQAAGQNQPVPPICLTRIPVPRTDAPTSPPKLPPEIAKIASPVGDKTQTDKKIEFTKTQNQESREAAPKENLMSLKESLANVQRLIEQQEKLNKKVNGGTVMKIDAKDSGGKNVVFYVEPVSEQNVPAKTPPSSEFIQDSAAGRFKCTLCGYTCEHQRTIKAHIWKHSGNKNIDYPMFQNGPLSVYDDENIPTRIERTDNVIEIITASNEVKKSVKGQMPPLIKSVPDTDPAGTKMPPFIVYEHTKISNVAPALAHLIAARTMAGMRKTDGDPESTVSMNSEESENASEMNTDVFYPKNDVKGDEHQNKENRPESEISGNDQQKVVSLQVTEVPQSVCKNVVVETVANVTTAGEYTGYTGLQSQQNSPRVATRSPDSGITEMTSTAKSFDDNTIVSSDLTLPTPVLEQTNPQTVGLRRSERKRGLGQQYRNKAVDESAYDNEESSASKKVKVLQAHEDSAVTLLSLLKKGPNFNPACPPSSSNVTQPPLHEYSNISSPGQDDSNSLGESEISGSKPKSGISTSLLAVIEQLRERSKSDADDDKPIPMPAKKTTKRRSRKSSQEDTTPASGIENVEEFSIDGEVKFRCKLCHYTNESTVLLRQHMRLHKPKQEFECSLCDLIAESSEALQDHMIQHCKVRTYQCKLCNSTFNYKSQLRAHMRMHNDQDILFCDFCDFETRNLSGMKLHTKSHLTKPPYKCEACQEDFISSHNLRIHKRDGCNSNIDKNNTSFKCEECDFVFFGRREMKNHLRLHMGKSKALVPNRCPYCDHSDSSIENIQKHVSDVHGESKPLKCDMCGFFAVSIRSLKSHMKRHVNDQRFVAQPLEQYKCNLCGYVCHHLPSLKSHMWRHAADQHYSYEFTNDVINAAIDFDGQTDVPETTQTHVEKFKALIFEKMKAKGLENTHGTLEESAVACCWVTFRCCQCGFETINKAELNMHMSDHSDVIKMTLEIGDVIIENQGNEVEVS